MSTIFRYLVRMGLPALAGALVWGITWPWRLSRRKRKGKVAGPYREGAMLFLFMFLSGLLWLTLTPPDLEYFLQTGRWLYPPGVPFQGGINLVPIVESVRLFQFYWEKGMWSAILVNVPGNIIMFMPVGLFAGLLGDKPRWWKGTGYAFTLSLFIELSQLFVARGTDVDDLLLNTLGGFAGYGVFLLIQWAAPYFVQRCKEM